MSASQPRLDERRALLEKLKNEVKLSIDKFPFTIVENKEQRFYFFLHFAMVKHILKMDCYHQFHSSTHDYEDAAAAAFSQIILKEIKEFQQSEEEGLALIAELMIEATKTAVAPTLSALSFKEMSEQGKAFAVPIAVGPETEIW